MAAMFFLGCQRQFINDYEKEHNRVIFHTCNGTLAIYPLSDNTVRVQFKIGDDKKPPEFVFVNHIITPDFNVAENGNIVRISIRKLIVEVNKKDGNISFLDNTGNIILKERAGSRIMLPDSVMGEPRVFVQQSFESPEDEFLFGLGQFQDGYHTIKGVTRRLIQVNSQISLPFIYSNKGYGLLWHQYGLTDFNPADSVIPLKKIETNTGNID